MQGREFIEKVIFGRRSIRKFDRGRDVPDEYIELILKAGMAAPSAWNRQPWAFIVVKDPDKRKELAGIHRYARMCEDAPVVFAVLGNENDEKWIEGCSAATENMLLAIHALGLGAVWVDIRDVSYGSPNDEEVARRILKVPEGWRVLNLIPVGYPAEEKAPRTQFKPEKVFLNEFGKKWGR